ncbi:unnamed protein product [Rotaria sordida]|uniref:Nucleolar GTP-binding protein 2 n=2 Tax=Rotaria sordida TaxID=392033 RepID=A0A819DGY5_9BILA|nr:unnamed protein product [Rotaria sordida]CAF1231853.1 unnamed protein product [Rotaria sordida]CAF1279097.1 unnamed protein product [Rotaria sordida]CAF3693078.1 unnamed protein product [Rotaria sordida]CAF3829586.1 unnamed protein product [Rotaria sordida]
MSKNKKRKNQSSPSKAPSTSHSLSLKNRSSSKATTSSINGAKIRSQSTVKRLQMYRGGKPKRDPSGRIVQSALFQERLPSGTQARVAPNRQWFNNSRVVTQTSLQKFQAALSTTLADPYQVVMKQTQLPVTLLNEKGKQKRVHILDVESYESTFGPKSQRKRPSNVAGGDDMEALVVHVEQKQNEYDQDKDLDLVREHDGIKQETINPLFKAGQSKRIWKELYKVIDSSDVVIQVLDARNPEGTRCRQVESYLKKEKAYKHLIFILNKCDLVPVWVTQRWVAILSRSYPTLAFHANMRKSFGKQALIQLLRQFSRLHQDKKQISVGFIGYPNVGKSSVINTLRSQKVCNVAPIAGETKVWQYITLMKRIFLIDCPGIVYPADDSETEIVLKGVVRVENVPQPDQYIDELLKRVKHEYIIKTYSIDEFTTAEDFLEKLARKMGKLLKGAEPDLQTVAKMVLNDYQRGKLPHYVPPPEDPNRQENDEMKSQKEPVEEKKNDDEQENEETIKSKSKKDKKKRKKTGSNFYETHNAKNRPRKQQQEDSSNDDSDDDHGAKKKKKKKKR